TWFYASFPLYWRIKVQRPQTDVFNEDIMGRIFSGIQPTGDLHIGNYLGAIRHWVNMQHEHESLICIVDLHALTTLPSPQKLQNYIRELAAALLASGIDPDKASIFPQSAVPAHCELAWIL